MIKYASQHSPNDLVEHIDDRLNHMFYRLEIGSAEFIGEDEVIGDYFAGMTMNAEQTWMSRFKLAKVPPSFSSSTFPFVLIINNVPIVI